MTRNSPRLSDEYTRTRQQQQQHHHHQQQQQQQHSRPSSQHSHHLHSPHTHSPSQYLAHSGTHSPHPPTTRHSQRTSHKSSKSSLSSQNPLGSSPLKMVTSTASSRPPSEDAQYYYLPDVDVDLSDGQRGGLAWMEPIVIDDEDLMFGGKSLSAWYEEERQSVNYPIEEEQEERRGRQRIRQQHHHHHHQHHEHHHHHHPHHHMSGAKNAPNTNDQKRH
ncbi:hypothetical protein F4859DRAFT_337809 [Xylaria cf. heliscus]|nr:hypothetical protein F4859DRAFT_337809 [Xylaria cf. heliscus]